MTRTTQDRELVTKVVNITGLCPFGSIQITVSAGFYYHRDIADLFPGSSESRNDCRKSRRHARRPRKANKRPRPCSLERLEDRTLLDGSSPFDFPLDDLSSTAQDLGKSAEKQLFYVNFGGNPVAEYLGPFYEKNVKVPPFKADLPGFAGQEPQIIAEIMDRLLEESGGSGLEFTSAKPVSTSK